MLRNSVLILWLVSAAASGANAQSDQSDTAHVAWGDAGGWSIMIDPTVGNGCYMERTTEDGTLVQVGLVPQSDGGFFAAYNAAWQALAEETGGTLYFDFGETLFGGEYVIETKGDLVGGYAFFNNPQFIDEFGRRNEVIIEGERGNALDFKLTGTLKSIKAVRDCDAEQESSDGSD